MSTQNAGVREHLTRCCRAVAEHRVYRVNVFAASFFFELPADDRSCLYADTNAQLRPAYFDYLRSRLLDVGVMERFHWLHGHFVRNYDVPFSDFHAKTMLPQYVDMIK